MFGFQKEDTFSPSPSQNLEVQGNVEDAFVSNVEFGDGDIDDELDPAVKEELDR